MLVIAGADASFVVKQVAGARTVGGRCDQRRLAALPGSTALACYILLREADCSVFAIAGRAMVEKSARTGGR